VRHDQADSVILLLIMEMIMMLMLMCFRYGRQAAARRRLRLHVITYVTARLIYSLSLTATLVMTLLVTSAYHDVTSLDRNVNRRLTRDADDVITDAERSLLGDARQQRDTWRREVTACQRHVTQLTAHVSQLTSGATWRHLNTYQLPGALIFSFFLNYGLDLPTK